MDDIKKLLGKRIREIRLAKKLKQETLAEMACIEPPTLSNIENGKNYPASETLNKIANALGVLTYELYMFEHIKTPSIKRMIEEVSNAMIKDEKLARHIYLVYQSLNKY